MRVGCRFGPLEVGEDTRFGKRIAGMRSDGDGGVTGWGGLPRKKKGAVGRKMEEEWAGNAVATVSLHSG